jgi:hypothetical protein
MQQTTSSQDTGKRYDKATIGYQVGRFISAKEVT